MRSARRSVSTPTSTQPNRPARRRREAAAGGLGQPDRARARRIELGAHALGVAAQQALLEAVRQRLLGEAPAWSGSTAAWCRPAARRAPAARRDSRRASPAPGSSRSPRRRSCAPGRRARPAAADAARRGGRRCRPRPCVRSCALGQLSARDARGRARARRRSGCAAPTRSRTGAAGAPRAAVRSSAEVGAVLAARHGQQAQAERAQPRVFDRPAGLVDEHAVAGAQSGCA